METLEDLIAAAEIRSVKALYFRAMDTKQWSLLEQVFTPDATCDYRGALADPRDTEEALAEDFVEGREAIIGYIRKGLEPLVSVHQGFLPEIAIESPCRASAIWAMTDRLILSDSPIAQIIGYGHYHETYRKDDGQWRIATLRLTRLRLDRISR